MVRSDSSGYSYSSADSPRGPMTDEVFQKLMQETSRTIASFNQVTRQMQQKMSLFNTPQDSRNNHEQLNQLVEKGKKYSTRISLKMKELAKSTEGVSGPSARARKTQMGKLSSDFKTQLSNFETTCQEYMESERNAINQIRRTSMGSFSKKDSPEGRQKLELNNYSEDQLYAQANIQNYDEDDLARREEDIIHINHQLNEVNAAFKEVDGLVQDQGEVVVEIDNNANEAQERVEAGLNQVQQADKKTAYCNCSKWKLIISALVVVIIVVVILAVVTAVK